jgi:methylmalonyl-CoA mutase C-terminal domain/subunit
MTTPTPADSAQTADPAGDRPGAATPEAPGTASRPIRVVVAKPGLDGHDRGIKVVARALRDAGMEVIYTGLHQTPEQIVAAALAEDADAVGLSVLSGAHMTQFRRVVALLGEADAADIIVFGGGIIPAEDIKELAGIGVTGIFTPGAPTATIVEWLRAQVAPRLAADD